MKKKAEKEKEHIRAGKVLWERYMRLSHPLDGYISTQWGAYPSQSNEWGSRGTSTRFSFIVIEIAILHQEKKKPK